MSSKNSSRERVPGPSWQRIPNDFSECIQACHECLQACEICATSCLAEADVAHLTRCIALDRSCADHCAAAEREMLRNSPFVGEVCLVCAMACEACAEECSQHEMEHCQDCAAACRRCAGICHQMSVTVGVGRP